MQSGQQSTVGEHHPLPSRYTVERDVETQPQRPDRGRHQAGSGLGHEHASATVHQRSLSSASGRGALHGAWSKCLQCLLCCGASRGTAQLGRGSQHISLGPLPQSLLCGVPHTPTAQANTPGGVCKLPALLTAPEPGRPFPSKPTSCGTAGEQKSRHSPPAGWGRQPSGPTVSPPHSKRQGEAGPQAPEAESLPFSEPPTPQPPTLRDPHSLSPPLPKIPMPQASHSVPADGETGSPS